MPAAPKPPHPGRIRFEDDVHGTVAEKAASEVPEGVAYAHGPSGLVPVVRVTARMRGEQRIIQSFASDGQLLLTTVQVKDDIHTRG